ITSRASSGSLGMSRRRRRSCVSARRSSSAGISSAKAGSSSASSRAAARSSPACVHSSWARTILDSSAKRRLTRLARAAAACTAGSESSSWTRRCSSISDWTDSNTAARGSATVARGGDGLLHLHEELDVRAGLLELLEDDAERVLLVHAGEGAAQLPRDLHLVGAQQHLLSAGRRRVDVDGREDALVGELAAEAQLHVARALELLEDDLVHLRARLDEGRREDRERSAVLDVARGAEELLRRVQRRRVDA